jgi:hypothetical protein
MRTSVLRLTSRSPLSLSPNSGHRPIGHSTAEPPRPTRSPKSARPKSRPLILESGGGSNGIVPTNVHFPRDLRALCTERRVVRTFHEVITGLAQLLEDVRATPLQLHSE